MQGQFHIVFQRTNNEKQQISLSLQKNDTIGKPTILISWNINYITIRGFAESFPRKT